MANRWKHVTNMIERSGPFTHPEFTASDENLSIMREYVKVLVVGAGGLGCELLKNLALNGFVNIHVIDMDTIDVSNLNRQFLFRQSDVCKPKAEVAAAFINERIPGAKVTPHFAKIQDFDEEFYGSFEIIICGLDSVVARRWLNNMIVGLLRYDENDEVDESSVKPLIDGGTEGFKGNVRVILPGRSPCIECTLNLYPPQITYPLCTIAHTPRLPEHCVEYVRLLLWPQDQPFGDKVSIDGDDPQHINWIFTRSIERANDHSIQGVTYRLVQGVIKHIVPAVASTNAVIAAQCATEAIKLATCAAPPLNNYMVFNDTDGVYSYSFEGERNPDCPTCSSKPIRVAARRGDTLKAVLVKVEEELGLRGVKAVTTVGSDGGNRTLYMSVLHEQTRKNLEKTLIDLGLHEGQEVYIVDETRPNHVTIQLHYTELVES